MPNLRHPQRESHPALQLQNIEVNSSFGVGDKNPMVKTKTL